MPVMTWEDRDFLWSERLREHHEEDMSWEDEEFDD